MDEGWAAMAPSARLSTIRQEIQVGWFKSAREKWLSRLAGEPGIAEVVEEVEAAERHQSRAVFLLSEMERGAKQ